MLEALPEKGGRRGWERWRRGRGGEGEKWKGKWKETGGEGEEEGGRRRGEGGGNFNTEYQDAMDTYLTSCLSD